MRSKKHSSHASTTRANPLPRGSACLGCRSRRVKCDGEWPCKACIRHSRFHSLPDEDCQCVYAAPSTKSAGKRTAPPGDETTSDGAEGVVVVEEEVQPRPFGQPDSERLMELESHMAQLERKIQSNLRALKENSVGLPLDVLSEAASSPSPSSASAPSEPPDWYPQASSSASESQASPELLPTWPSSFFGYPAFQLSPALPPQSPFELKPTPFEHTTAVSRWIDAVPPFPISPPIMPYNSAFIDPAFASHAMGAGGGGGVEGATKWEDMGEWQWDGGVLPGVQDAYDDGWIDWSAI